MKWIIAQLRKESWSPYTSGAMLGLVVVFSVWLTGHSLGASGSFENVAGGLLKVISPQAADTLYWKHIMPAGISWQVYLLIGVFLGSLAASLLSSSFKLSANPDFQWRAVWGPQAWKRWLAAFVGAIILEYGAGIAGGCTSGLAISGGVALAPAAFIFITGMFISGILVTMLIYRRKF